MYLIIFFFFFFPPFSIMYTNASYYILYIEYVQVWQGIYKWNVRQVAQRI